MSRVKQAIVVIGLVFVILLGAGVVLYDSYAIISSNMVPTLPLGGDVIVRSGGTPTVNDIVVFDAPESVGEVTGALVSRVVAVGGQEVTLVDGALVIDGLLIDEPFVIDPTSTEPRGIIPGCAQGEPLADTCVVPEGFGFVMGDNRRSSSDSRVFGPIDLDTVRGVEKNPPFWLFVELLS